MTAPVVRLSDTPGAIRFAGRHLGADTREVLRELGLADAEIDRAQARRGGVRPAVSTIRRRVVVHGPVQGVFFRDTTRRSAEALGVAGWARNRDDGTVEAVFEGSPEAVDALVEFAAEGPPDAFVERVEAYDEWPELLSGFEVG